jgi:prepilin-type N-terminal cleavage/methylation domain-containing protein
MHARMLKSRAGFTLAEVLVALTLTAVLGAALTGAFVSQSKFFDKQEKVGAARAVTRSSLNMLLSELRMVERTGGVEAAEADSLTINVPYAMGLYCGVSGTTMHISVLPADSFMLANAGYSGFAYRTSDSTYTYEDRNVPPSDGADSECTGLAQPVTVLDGVLDIPLGQAGLKAGTAILLYQQVSYVFRASTSVPGTTALWRRVHHTLPVEEELVAPFAPTAGFGYYVGDVVASQPSVAAASLDLVTGIELTLDGLSERPESDGTHQTAPYSTSIFFKNR